MLLGEQAAAVDGREKMTLSNPAIATLESEGRLDAAQFLSTFVDRIWVAELRSTGEVVGQIPGGDRDE